MKKRIFAIAATAAAIGTVAVAQDYSANLKARQGQFRIMALNIGILGGMAQGKIDYNAEAAQRAADTLVAVSKIDPGPLWPEGSDTMSIDGTRAMPAIWDNHDDFLSKWGDFGEAAANIQQVAANGQEALGPAVRNLGGACKACHDDYREPE